MKFLENRRIAWAAYAVCAVLSIFCLGGVRMRSDQAKVEAVYYEGTDTALSSRHSMDAYLDRAADAAGILAQEGTLYLGEEDAQCFLTSRLAQDLRDTESISDRYNHYLALINSVEALYTALEAENLSEKQMLNASAAYGDFKGAVNLVKNDQYHQLAANYNKNTSGFPAKLIRDMFGLEEQNTYGW